ncbi:MAG: hypothetical protein HLUCCO16_12240 [Phormidium sp. OSCR]|nr:MAG: hypothetical protein HLUCCO16_12240 [Phormidium sp. OSCR]
MLTNDLPDDLPNDLPNDKGVSVVMQIANPYVAILTLDFQLERWSRLVIFSSSWRGEQPPPILRGRSYWCSRH